MWKGKGYVQLEASRPPPPCSSGRTWWPWIVGSIAVCLLVLGVVGMAMGQQDGDWQALVQQLESAHVVGDVVKAPFNPTLDLKVTYGGLKLQAGQQLTPSATAVAPKVEIAGRAMNGDLYLLLLVDPDAPSPANPTRREWLHWIVADIPGGTDSSAGRQVVAYNGPTPPTGVHRYVFLLFRQTGPLSALTEGPASRGNFNSQAFAAQNGLGQPVAATYFTAEKET